MAEANDMTLRTTGVDAREEVESTEYATVRVPEDTQSGRPRLPGAPDHPNYEILEELGRGGMGIVYRARDRKRNRIVALKTLQGFSPAALYLFKQEFRTLAAVSHANLVTLLELISDGGQWFFTMEYVEGVNFKTYVRDNPPRLRDAFRQLATGLMRMHERSVLHRDLKPGNVMVDGTGRVVILDFGLAEELNRTGAPDDESRQFLGTLAYMSPEQAALKPLGPATDWYSFGVMLYEAITGKLPLSGSPLELIQRKQSADPPAPSQLVPHVSDDLNQLCVGLLHRQAESRPAGADVVAQLSIASDESCGQPSDVSFAHRDAQLFGRESHVADLRDAFAAVQRGEPTVVTISGRSGMGKSALVRSFLSDPAVRERAVILAGRCYEQESVPYKAFDGIIDSLSRYLKRQPTEKVEAILPRDVAPAAILFPVLQQVPAVAHAHRSGTRIPDSKELQKRAFGSLRELFARLGDRRPLIIEIDDLQWGDADSAALLAELLRPPDPPVFLLLAVQRSEDASSSRFLREFERTVAAAQPTVRHHLISVGALAIEEAAALAFTLLDEADVARDVAQKVARESAGNPLFVFELVQNLRAGNVLSGRSSRPGDLVLEDVLWQRVARLPDGARRFLEAVAVAGRPVAVGDASTAAGCDGEDLAVLTQLRSGRLIRCVGSDDNNEVETYHDRVRASIVGHLSAVERVRYHARLAEVLSASGRGDAETLLVHYEAAGDHQRAAACCVKAADQAAGTLAFDRAAQLYRRSLELAAAEDPVRRELVRKLADALANAGRGKEAAETYLSLAEEAGDTDGFEYRR
ncbi:MAG: hypothetical protein FJ276_26820, partial [Planctomycetes bacterium]|nr:hypothetical protein [Planctomycetota bacterium]